jgi:acetyl esterase/lipase
VLLFFVSVWTVIPAPTASLLALSVAAPELSPWLFVLATIAASAALPRVRRGLAARVALVLSITAAGLAGRVLAQIPSTIRTFEAAMTAAIGTERPTAVPQAFSGARRPAPLLWRELLTGLGGAPVGIVSGIEFARHGDELLTLTVYRPASDRPVPVVVQIYGGAWQRGGPDDDRALAAAIARGGCLVVALDYRHAPRWRWPAQLDDVRAGLQWVRAHAAEHGGDASKIALVGRSSGSQLAMRAAFDPAAPPVAAVVGYYGPVDLIEGYRAPPSPDPLDVRAIESALIGGTPEERPAAYADASPITFAGRPHAPALIVAAGRDHIVEPRFTRRLHAALSQSGTSILLTVPWADHAFDKVPFGPASQIALYHVQRFLEWAFWRAG